MSRMTKMDRFKKKWFNRMSSRFDLLLQAMETDFIRGVEWGIDDIVKKEMDRGSSLAEEVLQRIPYHIRHTGMNESFKIAFSTLLPLVDKARLEDFGGALIRNVISIRQPIFVSLLLDAGVKPNPTVDFPFSVFSEAVSHGEHESLNLLLDSVKWKLHPFTEPSGWSPLSLAAKRGDFKCMESLLLAGADPNCPVSTNHGGFYPLHYAVERGHFQCIELLLNAGADTMACSNDGEGGRFSVGDIFVKTTATSQEDLNRCSSLLVKFGLDFSQSTYGNVPPLIRAASNLLESHAIAIILAAPSVLEQVEHAIHVANSLHRPNFAATLRAAMESVDLRKNLAPSLLTRSRRI